MAFRERWLRVWYRALVGGGWLAKDWERSGEEGHEKVKKPEADYVNEQILVVSRGTEDGTF